MKRYRATILVGLFIIITGCISKRDSFNLYLSKQKNIQFLVDQGLSHWGKRVNAKDAEMAKLFLSKANDLNPDNGEVASLYAQSCHFLGYYIEPNEIRLKENKKTKINLTNF